MGRFKETAVRLLSCAIPSSRARKSFRAKFLGGVSERREKKSPYQIEGKNNRIVVIRDGRSEDATADFYMENVNIKIVGDDNLMVFEFPLSISGSTLHINGSHNRMKFSRGVRGVWAISAVYDNNKMEVGEYTDSGEFSATLHGNDLRIGRHCMFSTQIELWTDGHSVVDKRSKLVKNTPKTPVSIGDFVWIGRGVKLCKGARIPSYSIAGFGSVITRGFDEEHCVLGGNPAVVLKRGISWHGLAPTLYAKRQRLRKIFFVCENAGVCRDGSDVSDDCPYPNFKNYFDEFNLEFCSAKDGIPNFEVGDVAIVSAGDSDFLADIGEHFCAAIRWGAAIEGNPSEFTERQKSAFNNFALPEFPEEGGIFVGATPPDSSAFFERVSNFIEEIKVPRKSAEA